MDKSRKTKAMGVQVAESGSIHSGVPTHDLHPENGRDGGIIQETEKEYRSEILRTGIHLNPLGRTRGN